MSLHVGQTIAGFTVEKEHELPEIDCHAFLLSHTSGTTLIYLESPYPEKAFSINFKTLPSNDTGVFHVLEHSVLCGSEHYPVKEPFTHLKKTSMKTFLNAMTCTNQTMYPVATTNETDLYNLVDVYMDAVLHPLLLENEDILRQEGWHLEAPDGNLSVSGVVYNEMKGALSNPPSNLARSLTARLFPGTSYSYSSGGDPASIPNLTQEEFVDTYKRHYRLDNSLIMLYGDMDITAMLTHLDEVHLSPVAEEHAARVGKPNEMGTLQLITQRSATIPMNISPDEQGIGLYFALEFKREEPFRLMAADVLCQALLGKLESPLAKALTDTGITPVAIGDVENNWTVPFVVVFGINADPSRLDEFRTTLVEEAMRIANEGVPQEELSAAIDALEFRLHECTFGGRPKGLQFFFDVAEGWLSGEDWLGMLRYADIIDFLRNPGTDTYYEDLLREMIVDNPRWVSGAVVSAENVDMFDEKARLAKLGGRLSEEELASIQAQAEELAAKRTAPDSADAAAKMPRLTLSDVGPAPKRLGVKVTEIEGIKRLRLDAKTNEICYVIWNFDIGDMPLESLQDLSLLTSFVNLLPTKHHTAQQLQTAKSRLFADAFNCSLEFANLDYDEHSVGAHFTISTKFLSRNAKEALSLIREIVLETDFSQKERIVENVGRYVALMANSLATGDMRMISDRAMAQFRAKSMLDDATNGTPTFEYLLDLQEHLGDAGYLDELIDTFETLRSQILASGPALISFAGSDTDWNTLVEGGGLFADARSDAPSPTATPIKKAQPLGARREVFAVNGSVCITCQPHDLRAGGYERNGQWHVAVGFVEDELLWNEIRVKGGAYGGMANLSKSGVLTMKSYRDSKPLRSLSVFDAVPAWARDYKPAQEELEGQIISTLAGIDRPNTVGQQLSKQNAHCIIGRSFDDETVTRKEILASTADGIAKLCKQIEGAQQAEAIGASILAPVSMIDQFEGFEIHDPLGLLEE